MPSMVEESAGTEMACAPDRLFGRALSAEQASSQALAVRELIYTLEAPDWRILHGVLNQLTG